MRLAILSLLLLALLVPPLQAKPGANGHYAEPVRLSLEEVQGVERMAAAIDERLSNEGPQFQSQCVSQKTSDALDIHITTPLPVLTSDQRRAWLLLVVRVVGDELNRHPELNTHELWIADKTLLQAHDWLLVRTNNVGQWAHDLQLKLESEDDVYGDIKVNLHWLSKTKP